jgi:hypothetical protein
MTRRLTIVAVIAVAFVRLQAAQTVLDYVVARVGDESIFMTDVRAAIGLGVVELGSDPDPQEAALQRLIDRRVMRKEILRGTPPQPTPEAIDAEVQRMKSYAAGTLKAVMDANGVDEGHLRQLAIDTLRIQLYLDMRFPRLDVNDADAEQYYRAHPNAFSRNGVMMTFDQAKSGAHELAAQERRDTRISQWVTGLKKRTDVSRPPRPAAAGK